ncbi:ABC transporter ATP-binding protein [Mycoplasma sp. CSL7503-lung]|uniref:ABC transporter ATP-binding protein n=1 Tax=Mycoplasma sp. CSL7503-lung TaxID=536372 RepID=UPI0021D01431|nr:ABC transporter ATP-binding protein [Mycoplasma sp. CSL7503-lung]MCU4706599.1 ABC transporter ATP-binding protein/permease [Mycoplasma sp. CSL7503-lung]
MKDIKKQKNYYKNLKRLLSFVNKDKKSFYLAMFFSFINAIFYIGGSYLIGYIVSSFFEPLGNGKTFSDFETTKFFLILTVLVLSYLVYGIFRYSEQYIYAKISYQASARLRNEIVDKLIHLDISFYDKNKTGDLISNLVIDANNIANSLFQLLSQLISAFFNITITIVMMFLVSTALSLIIIPITLISFGMVFLLIKKSQPYFIKMQMIFGELNAFVEESLQNTKITNAFNKQEHLFNQLTDITKRIRDTAFKGDFISKSFDSIYTFLSNFLILIITGISAYFYFRGTNVLGVQGFGADINGHATAGLIFTFISINWNFLGPFQALMGAVFNIQVGIASTNRISKLLDEPLPKTDHEIIRIVKISYNENVNDFLECSNEDPFGFFAWKIYDPNIEKYVYKSVKGNVEFKNVYFSYDPTKNNKYQLKNASFKVKQGQNIAIVGPTGAGKTTIINLISKYYNYQKGSITIDGFELKNINRKDLKRIMTIVSQDSFLFNETILDNLNMSNEGINENDIQNAIEMTQSQHFIDSLPKGINTLIENNGQNISQGQKQLLSITRSILSNKNILILDEATSNIDSNTEIIVQKSMLNLMKYKTSFVIAHRLSTIKNADLILVVNNGEIIETGTHKSLIESRGFYYDMYTSQFIND